MQTEAFPSFFRAALRHTTSESCEWVSDHFYALPKIYLPFSRLAHILSADKDGFTMRVVHGYYEGRELRQLKRYSLATTHCIAGWMITLAAKAEPLLIQEYEYLDLDSFLLSDAILARSGHRLAVDYFVPTVEGRRQVYRFAKMEQLTLAH